MVRRWCIPLVTLPVVVGSMLAAGAASASPGLAHHAAAHRAAQAVSLGHPMITPVGAGLPSLGSNSLNTTVESTNWSGYGVTGRRGAFRSVSASWVQPRARCAGVPGHRFAAFWVGLDGFNSGSVEQTGSDTDCVGLRPTYYGWFEMFPQPPVLFRNKIIPGDHMAASVTFRGSRTYILVLRDLTRRWSHTIVRNEAGLARSSAEIITEAPATAGGSILPLADFGAVRYNGSRVNGALLRRVRPIRILMVNARNQLKDTTSLISRADAFGNAWLRSF